MSCSPHSLTWKRFWSRVLRLVPRTQDVFFFEAIKLPYDPRRFCATKNNIHNLQCSVRLQWSKMISYIFVHIMFTTLSLSGWTYSHISQACGFRSKRLAVVPKAGLRNGGNPASPPATTLRVRGWLGWQAGRCCRVPWVAARTRLDENVLPSQMDSQGLESWAQKTLSGLGKHFSCKFPYKVALVTCWCAFRLRRLVQSVRRGSVQRHFSCKFPHKVAVVTCWCAFRLRGLALGLWSPMTSILFRVETSYPIFSNMKQRHGQGPVPFFERWGMAWLVFFVEGWWPASFTWAPSACPTAGTWALVRWWDVTPHICEWNN